jgi:hypothetical protein
MLVAKVPHPCHEMLSSAANGVQLHMCGRWQQQVVLVRCAAHCTAKRDGDGDCQAAEKPARAAPGACTCDSLPSETEGATPYGCTQLCEHRLVNTGNGLSACELQYLTQPSDIFKHVVCWCSQPGSNTAVRLLSMTWATAVTWHMQQHVLPEAKQCLTQTQGTSHYAGMGLLL